LRSDDVTSAIGLLHQEMRMLDSIVMRSADANKIPAGSALAVDREGFSKFIESELLKTERVKISRCEISDLPVDSNEKWIVATGPFFRSVDSFIFATCEELLHYLRLV
jgi:methylenetetrahydrofolate--tRNA-(uracil-5-)-methyltransferase